MLLTRLVLGTIAACPLVLSIYRGGEATANFVAEFDSCSLGYGGYTWHGYSRVWLGEGWTY